MNTQHRDSGSVRVGFALAACLLVASAACAQAPAESPPTPTQPEPTPTAPVPADQTQKPASTPIAEVELLLTDGRRLTGQFINRTDSVIILRIAGIETSLPVSEVADVKPLKPVEERHADLRAAIDDQDESRLLRLAEWAFNRGRADLAIGDIEQVLKVNPTNEEAQRLQTLVRAQLELDRQRRDADPSLPPEQREPALKPPPFPLLNGDQINIIRVYEVDLAAPPRMKLDEDTLKRFVDLYAGQGPIPASKDGRASFMRRPIHKILQAMFELQAREFYGEVKISENPRPIRLFRENVSPWLIGSCSTSDCHGGQSAGRFQLYNKRPNSDATLFTNFLIIDRFRTSDGQALIDYENPPESPLLQYALPRDAASFPHPELVKEKRNQFRSVFRSTNDDRFKAAAEWIPLMYQPRPDYPIEYTPPGRLTPPPTEAPKPAQPR